MCVDIAKLVLQYLQALVWPLIVVLALILMRSQLGALIGRLIVAKVPGAELTFAEQVLVARAEADDSRDELVADLQGRDQGVGPAGRNNAATVEALERLSQLPVDTAPLSANREALLSAWATLFESLMSFSDEIVEGGRYASVTYATKIMGLPDSWREAFFRVFTVVGLLERDEAQLSHAVKANLARTLEALSTQLHVARDTYLALRKRP